MKHSKTLSRIAIALFALSAAIYAAQILIFHDPRTTAFYIFQDFAFLPASIAIATVAVGAILDEHDRREIAARQKKIESLTLQVHLTRAAYDGVRDILEESRMELLILGSTHNLNEAERFTEMLWGIFHIMDEYRLRGDWDNLSPTDIAHLETDFAQVLRLMLANSVSNNVYLKATYPNFYGAAAEKLMERRRED